MNDTGTGTIRSWEAGIGWIVPDDGTSEVIFPHPGPWRQGDPVTFSVVLTGMGYVAKIEEDV